MEQQICSPLESRLWRPAAQRRVRNAWASIFAEQSSWISVSSKGLSVANALVNALLSERYLSALNLGALRDMMDIHEKARLKLRHQQEAYSDQLLKIYKDLVKIICRIIEASRSMRTYLKGPISSPLVEFSGDQKLDGDVGDGGGVAVFSTLSIQSFETFAEELVAMFISELNVKWLLASEMHSAVWPNKEFDRCELYATLMKAIGSTNVCSSETQHFQSKVSETSNNFQSGRRRGAHLRHDTLQVYLIVWLAEVHINKQRVDKLKELIAEEMAPSKRYTP